MIGRERQGIMGQFILLMASFLIAVTVEAGEISGPAPDFTLKSNSGKNLKLSEYRGKVVLINFWASWCGPCRQEMPLLDKLHQKYASYGFTVLGVNVEEDSAAAEKVLKDITVSFPVLFDNRNSASKTYNVSAMPSTILVDRDGNMRYLHKGYKPGDEASYRKWVKQLIRE
jgi:thiol-disulfide isomerase/thioredoxin